VEAGKGVSTKKSVWTSRALESTRALPRYGRYNFFQGGDDGRGYINMCKIAGGSVLDLL
jgi:hypothetical protein